MLYDSGVNDDQRIIIFGLPDIVREFATSQVHYYFGNFSMAPRAFRQVFVMRFKFMEDHLTGLYALLPNKTRRTYERVFEATETIFQQQGVAHECEKIKMDFEDGMMRAASAIFGRHITISGCFYHLMQSTWR